MTSYYISTTTPQATKQTNTSSSTQPAPLPSPTPLTTTAPTFSTPGTLVLANNRPLKIALAAT